MEVSQTHFIIDWINNKEVSRLKNNFKPQMDAGYRKLKAFVLQVDGSWNLRWNAQKVDSQFNQKVY